MFTAVAETAAFKFKRSALDQVHGGSFWIARHAVTARAGARSLFMRSCMRLMPALAALLACARSEPDGVAQCDDAGATNWTDAEWEAARAEGLALARRGAASVLYLHIFKAGGTSVCAAAVAAGFVTPPGDENCNVPAALGCSLSWSSR